MFIDQSVRSFAALLTVLYVGAASFSVRAEPGMTVHERLEQQPLTQEQRAARFDKGVAAYDAGDYARAYDIWLPVAQTGDLAAMRNVALLLRQGKGVARDPERALYFYERAGRGGLVSAQVNTAFMYLDGDGTAQDYKTASFWFHAAAVAGVPVARYNLGVMYERGMGVERDPARALAWYGLAAQEGHEKALTRLMQLVPSLPGPPPPNEADGPLAAIAPAPPVAEIDHLESTSP
ncbi:MAG: sel1 repeat family protein [Parvibaculum sp.]|nr:sel1 repeat family protein [Parvibaculum sp.]